LNGATAQPSGRVDLQTLAGLKAKALVASAEILHHLAASGVPAKEIAPDLERVIVRASSECDVDFIRRNLEVQVSAFVPLDEEADVLLWMDDFTSGASFSGRPVGSASVFVLDEWGKVAPIGVRGRLYLKPQNNVASGMVPLSWFGRWQNDGILEINTRQFDTLELDAEELEELLR